MLDPLGNEKIVPFLKTALDAASIRHQVISANLANIDTPGYQARDLDFEGVLKDYQNRESMQPPYRNDSRVSLPPAQPLNYKDYVDETQEGLLTERFDGNNVNLDKEVAKMASARGKFQLAAMFMSRRSRLVNEIINSK